MPRLLIALALLVGLLPAQDPSTLRIGTWNIEFLGADANFRRDTPPRTADDLRAIGEHIRELGVCVLGVQEICGQEPLREITAAAGDRWRFVLGTSGQWSDGKTQQGVGFVYDDAAVELLQVEELLLFPSELEGLPVFHRKPVTACFRHRATGFDFRAVVVHLKAGRKDTDRQKRRLEATTLRAWFDVLLADPQEDHDIVLLGDFNSTYGDEPELVLEEGGALQYVDQQQPSPTIVHFDDPIDQICAASTFGELQRDSLVVHGVAGEPARRAFRKTYSDHFPITVELRAAGDDDPQARFARFDEPRAATANAADPNATDAQPADSAWPPPVGARVQVFVAGSLHRGALAAPLPVENGWVVVEGDDGLVAFPMHNVVWVRLQK